MKALVRDDLVVGTASGDIVAPDLPAQFADMQSGRLFFLNGEIVDGADHTTFHIDASGTKHIVAGPDRVAINCAWDDEIVADGAGGWRVRLAADDLLVHAAAKRYAVETGGIVVAGSTIRTDRDSQALINGAFALAKDQPAATIQFKSGSGFVQLSADDMIAIGRAVAAHVQACFAVEADVTAAIAAGTITTTAEIDAASWPANS